MVRLMCDEIIVDEKQTLKQWLSQKKNVSLDTSIERDALFCVRDDNGNNVLIFPSSLSERTLQRLGSKSVDEAIDVLRCCRVTFSPNTQELVCDLIDVPYCVELSIDEIPDQILNQRVNSEVIFGSAKDAIDCVNDKLDCAYSHIPIKIGKRIEYFDLRDVGVKFCKDIGTRFERDIDSYFQSLTLWMDSRGVLPFQHVNDSTLRLPLPPVTSTTFKEFRFSVKELVYGDAIKPSTQFGDWKFDGNDVYFCMAFKGQPFIYDYLQQRSRPFILWDELTDEAFKRMLSDCHWPRDKPHLFKKSFLSRFRFTRCMFSFCESRKEWAVIVPESPLRKFKKN